MAGRRAHRPALPFSAVNRRGDAAHDPHLQRHHFLPVQLVTHPATARLIRAVGRERSGFDDFRRNGLLLPAHERAAARTGLPLHRGPHRAYNELVLDRVGQIERTWAGQGHARPRCALEEALMRLSLLQAALRRRLLDPPGARFVLNRRDPIGTAIDFTELDAMAETLWQATEHTGRSAP